MTIPADEAKRRLETYVQRSEFPEPSQAQSIDDDVKFYAVALEGDNGLEQVQVMNSDDCKRPSPPKCLGVVLHEGKIFFFLAQNCRKFWGEKFNENGRFPTLLP